MTIAARAHLWRVEGHPWAVLGSRARSRSR